MKKLTLIITFLFVLLGLTACDSAKMASKTPGIDYSSIVKSKTKGVLVEDMGDYSLTAPYASDKEKLYVKDVNVIHGNVKESKSYIDDTLVYTISSITVTDSYIGEIEQGSMIKVRELGGFIEEGKLNNAITQEKFGVDSDTKDSTRILDIRINGYKVMEPGEDVILFLVKENEYYDLLRVWQGKLLYNKEHNVYAPYIPKDEKEYIEAKAYTLDEFETLISNIK